MLKPSKKAGGSPLIAEAKGHGGGAPKTVPNRPGSEKNRVLISGPAGKRSNSGTFKAPRKEMSGDATCCGYTKVG